jgi:hypothetical protein
MMAKGRREALQISPSLFPSLIILFLSLDRPEEAPARRPLSWLRAAKAGGDYHIVKSHKDPNKKPTSSNELAGFFIKARIGDAFNDLSD